MKICHWLLFIGATLYAAEFLSAFEAAKSPQSDDGVGPGGVPVRAWFSSTIGKVDPIPGTTLAASYAFLFGAVICWLIGKR